MYIPIPILDEAMPALRAAEKALQELNRNDIVEVKAMKKPPAGVVLVIESLCVVFDIKPIKVMLLLKWKIICIFKSKVI